MSCPVGTIKTYLYKGRKLLKESLVKKGIWEM
jgi:RNA polymerase sigma-70 factor (ECF subfamily)